MMALLIPSFSIAIYRLADIDPLSSREMV